jgi:hypothetical protein
MNHDRRPFQFLLNESFKPLREELKNKQLMKSTYLKGGRLRPQTTVVSVRMMLCHSKKQRGEILDRLQPW